MSGMATSLQSPPWVSLDDYFGMSFEGPDAEYVEGRIVHRPMPQRSHSRVQYLLGKVFAELEEAGRVDPYPELRVRVAPNKVRVPDYCVFRGRIDAEVPDSPPLLVVEIVSPSDVYSGLIEKLAEYRAWGVEHIWLIDPGLCNLWVYRGRELVQVDALELPELGVRLTPGDLFDRPTETDR